MADPTWAESEPPAQEPPKRKHECASADTAYSESYFDDWPPHKGKRATLANKHPYACSQCGASITALSDYGYMDFTMHEDDDEPEWVSMCWGCKRPIAYGESE